VIGHELHDGNVAIQAEIAVPAIDFEEFMLDLPIGEVCCDA